MLSLTPIPPLPPPPLLEMWVFERPWAVGLTLLALAALTLLTSSRRGWGRRGALLALAPAIGAVGLFITASLVTTGREQALALTSRFVGAVTHADTTAAASLIDRDVEIQFDGVVAAGLGRGWLLEVVGAFHGPLSMQSVSIRDRDASLDSRGEMATQFRVRVVSERFGLPSTSWWRLGWRQDGDGAWRITSIDCLLIDGSRPSPSLAREISGIIR